MVTFVELMTEVRDNLVLALSRGKQTPDTLPLLRRCLETSCLLKILRFTSEHGQGAGSGSTNAPSAAAPAPTPCE